MDLSQSHNPGKANPGLKFDKLTLVDLHFFVLFFQINFFSNFIHQHLIDGELSIVCFFKLFFMGLLGFHDPSREFGKLN
jgi:hypothetical protein